MPFSFATGAFILASPEQLFDLFVDPDELRTVCRRARRPVERISDLPDRIGATWLDRLGPLGLLSAKSTVTAIDRPRRISRRLTGAVAGTLSYSLTPRSDGTEVQQALEVAAHSRLLSRAAIKDCYCVWITAVKNHFEPHARDVLYPRIVGSLGEVRSSSLFPGTEALFLRYEMTVRASPELMFDVAVRRMEESWEWHIDRSDPLTEYEVVQDWPTKETRRHYKFRSSITSDGWERGQIGIRAVSEPALCVVREDHYDPPVHQHSILAEYQFQAATSGTKISLAIELASSTRFWRQVATTQELQTVMSLHFKKQFANMARVGERRQKLLRDN